MRIALTAWLAIICLTTQSTCAQTAVHNETARNETSRDEPTRGETVRDQSDQCRGDRRSDSKVPSEHPSPSSSSDRSSLQKPEELPIKYIGNCISLKFHRPSCPFGKAMAGSKAVFFHFRKQAIDDGYQPCRYCLPPFWKSVHAKILKSAD